MQLFMETPHLWNPPTVGIYSHIPMALLILMPTVPAPTP